MMLFAICVMVYPQVKIARLTGESEVATEAVEIVSTKQFEINNELLHLFLVLGGICLVVFGSFALFIGFLTVVHDFGNVWLTRLLILVAQTSWIPFLAGRLPIVHLLRVRWLVDSSHSFDNFVPPRTSFCRSMRSCLPNARGIRKPIHFSRIRPLLA